MQAGFSVSNNNSINDYFNNKIKSAQQPDFKDKLLKGSELMFKKNLST